MYSISGAQSFSSPAKIVQIPNVVGSNFLQVKQA